MASGMHDAYPTQPAIIQMAPRARSSSILTDILAGLAKPVNAKSLPTMLLYNEKGLRLYDDITTHAPEYYLFAAEENIFKAHADEIVQMMCDDSGVVLELGAGALRKTEHLLRALAHLPHRSTYLALDLERGELLRTLTPLASNNGGLGAELSGKVDIAGLCGTYEDGIKFVREGNLARELFEASAARRGRSPPGTRTPTLLRDEISTDQDATDASPSPESELGSHVSPERSSSAPTTPGSTHKTIDPTHDDHSLQPLHFLFLGSSLGNFTRSSAAEFLRSLPLRPGSSDTLLLGLDKRNDPTLVEVAYDDPRGYTRQFLMNGLAVASEIIRGATGSGEAFDQSKWNYVGRYDQEKGRHEAYYKCKMAHEIHIPANEPGHGERTVKFEKDELINIEYSYKYSDTDALTLFTLANLRPIHRWSSPEDTYSLWLLHRPPFQLPKLSSPSADKSKVLLAPSQAEPEPDRTGTANLMEAVIASKIVSPPTSPGIDTEQQPHFVPQPQASTMSESRPRTTFPAIPTMDEWREMWKVWDTITLGMIPREMMHQKPIDLRHKCLFYLGHIPAFLDIHLSRLLREPHTEPEYFKVIFERGIDPHVSDPTQCHPHSIVPDGDDKWPTIESILAFRDRVRARVQRVYADYVNQKDLEQRRPKDLPWRKVARVLWMTYEHEAFHAETLLYMLLQRAGSGTLPPPGFPTPDWTALAKEWDAYHEEAKKLEEKHGSRLVIGPGHVSLGHDDIEAQDDNAAPSSNYEFGWDNESPKRRLQVGKVAVEKRPVTNEEYMVFWEAHSGKGGKGKTGVGPKSWVFDGEGNVQVLTMYGPVPFHIAQHWPLVASYDELAEYARFRGGRIPTEPELRLFMDVVEAGSGGAEGAPWGFQTWHFIPASLGKGGVKPHNGGVWEWTSTLMDHHEGFTPSKLYPGYSADFFDGSHHIVLGGSFATIPRLAQRRSLRNFYQHDYPYAWIGARIAYDV